MNSRHKTTSLLKAKYIEYFEDVPIQKYAAMSIGRDEDTIIRWKKKDKEFADSVQIAKAQWVRKKLISTKAEFALEKLERSFFANNSIDEVKPDSVIAYYIPGEPYSSKSETSKVQEPFVS